MRVSCLPMASRKSPCQNGFFVRNPGLIGSSKHRVSKPTSSTIRREFICGNAKTNVTRRGQSSYKQLVVKITLLLPSMVDSSHSHTECVCCILIWMYWDHTYSHHAQHDPYILHSVRQSDMTYSFHSLTAMNVGWSERVQNSTGSYLLVDDFSMSGHAWRIDDGWYRCRYGIWHLRTTGYGNEKSRHFARSLNTSPHKAS